MENKLRAWKEAQRPPWSTNYMAWVLETSPGWLSTVLNAEDSEKKKRCSYHLALRIEIMTKGFVTVKDMKSTEAEIEDIAEDIEYRKGAYEE